MTEVRWERYPLVERLPSAHTFLKIQHDLGLAPNTIDAYGRGLQEYLGFCSERGMDPQTATKADVAAYVRYLAERPGLHGANVVRMDSGVGLSNATMQQRLVAIRLFYDHLTEEGIRETNPVGRGRYTVGKGFGGQRQRGLLPRLEKLPWIPTDEEWKALLEAARVEPIRNRFMLALAYDAGLRREELCSLRTEDLDPAHRNVRVRAETTKNRRERIVPYSASTGVLLTAYLAHRKTVSKERGPLFVSESRRNRGKPITLWTWSKVVRNLAVRAELPRFSTHTLRHLCLTDLARSGWEIHAIATFAGHKSPQSTLRYVHLSGRDLSEKLERGMAQIHTWRTRMLAEAEPLPEGAK